MDQPRITYLLTGALNGMLTPAEREELFALAHSDNREQLVELMAEQLAQQPDTGQAFPPEEATAKLSRILSLDKATHEPVVVPVHRVHLLKRAWWNYAAAVIFISAIGAYLWNYTQNEKPSVAQTNPHPVNNDVAPGGNKAVLTLADGRKIILDSAANGELAQQQHASIVKTAEGRLVYQRTGATGADPITVSYNTMSTPRGGQYQLQLPDGSLVWLNAASSITFPTAFTGDERRIAITGEAYFEVKKDASKPFRVKVSSDGGSVPATSTTTFTVEVLGTHFNVNSYTDESSYNTTLLEGSVRINTAHTSLILQPGQQGQWNKASGNLSLSTPDVEQVMAWKNGAFNFNRVTLSEAMRQISRWYDVAVVYENGIPDIRFGGMMGRDLTLSQVLNVLSTAGVKFRIEDRKLIVLQ